MKIAMYNLTTTVKSGGIEVFNWEVGAELERRGHQVHIFGGNGELRRPRPEIVFTFPYKDRKSYPDLGKRFPKMAERWSMARSALPVLARGGYDIVYLSKPHDLPWMLWTVKRIGAQCFLSVGGLEFFPGYRFLVRRLSLFTACSEFTASRIEEYCGTRPLVLYNGVDVQTFRPIAVPIELKKRLGIGHNSQVLISIGRLRKLKGFQYAIEAVARLRMRLPDLYYLVAGAGEERDYLEACARSAGLDSRVIFLGDVPHAELPKYIALADCAILPSIEPESFGIAAAEAMACGVPVVGTDIGGLPEVLGKTGKLCPPRDPESLAWAIADLLENPIHARLLGEKAYNRVQEKFTWKRSVDILEERAIYA